MKKDYDTKDAKGTVQQTEMYDEGIAEMSLPDMLKSLSFDKKVVITAVVMFFMGRAWIPGGLLPFGTAAFAAVVISPDCRMKNSRAVLYGISVLLGVLTLAQWWQLLIALFIMVSFYSAVRIKFGEGLSYAELPYGEFISPDNKKPFAVICGIIYFICSIGASVLVIAISSAKISDALLLLTQSIVGFAAFYVFRNVSLIFVDDIGRKVMTNEEMACIAIAVAVGLMGLPDIVFLSISVKRLLCIVVVMIFSYRGGLGTGAACGVTAGILISASKIANGGDLSSTIIAVYGFSGFLAGLFNRYRKVGVSIGFIMGNLLLAILFNESQDIIINIYEVGFAVILFAIIPDRFTEFLKLPQFTGVKVPTVKVNYAVKLRNMAVGKLESFSGIMREMSSVCKDFTEGCAAGNKDDLMQIVERTTDNICKKCMLCNSCWETNFYKTYQSFGVMVSILECRGKISFTEIPKNISTVCPNIDALLDEIKKGFEMWRIDCLWRRRMEETKKLLPVQLESMAEILDNLAKEVDLSVVFEDKIERNIIKSMADHELKIKNVTVSKNLSGRLEIAADIKCCGMKKACIKSYLPLLSRVTGTNLVIDKEATAELCGFVPPTENTQCHNDGKTAWCPMVFCEAEPFRIAVSSSVCPANKNRVCGDSHSFMQLRHGIYLMAISDGMGSGESAAAQSRSVIKLLELFMESGLGCTAAVAMINSLLETGSEKMISATVDLCLLDLYEGKATFLKLGAVPSVIKHGAHVDSIAVPALPMGMADDYNEIFDCKTIKRKIDDQDIIILMSDGVTEAFRENGGNRVDFYSCIENMNSSNPKQIADALVNLAVANCGGVAKDDMTVVAARIKKD
ncbi:MAG: stage II sporulation protein E [Clostridia bacterium]|nr:stage II sporulation protein E [Clostridia bacterium]